jgi:hypothetical protein
MRKLSQMLITLPLLAAPFMALKPAAAEPFTPLAAVELLAKSKAADAKCGFLSGEESQELSDYVARGEIAAAQQTSVDETRAALAQGRKLGAATICGPDAKAELGETLLAARQAMASVGAEDTPPPEDSAAAAAEPVKKKQVAQAPRAAPPLEERRGKLPGLKGYGGKAFAYYLDRRCGHLSRAQARRFYAAIIRMHDEALAASGKATVAKALRAAEAKAKTVSCGSQSASLVKSGYAGSVN